MAQLAKIEEMKEKHEIKALKQLSRFEHKRVIQYSQRRVGEMTKKEFLVDSMATGIKKDYFANRNFTNFEREPVNLSNFLPKNHTKFSSSSESERVVSEGEKVL